MEERQTRLLTIKGFTEKHEWPSEWGLRYWIANAHRNGFGKVVKRVGRRVLIDENMFFQWVEEQNV